MERTETRRKLADKLKQRNGGDEADDEAEGYRPKLVGAKMLPDGREVAELSPADLADALVKMKIPGAQRSNSHQANLALWSQHICSIYEDGGEQAVTMWRLENEDGGED